MSVTTMIFATEQSFDEKEFIASAVEASLKGFAVIAMIIGFVGCLFGFKLTKVFMGICAFIVGFGAGIALTIESSESFFIYIGFALGVGFIGLSYKFFKTGVFFKTIFESFPTGLAIMIFTFFRNMLPKDFSFDNLRAFGDIVKNSQALTYSRIFAVFFAVGIAVIAVKFTKPAIISITSVSFGTLTGISLGILIGKLSLCPVFAFVFTAVGFAFQILTNHGLLENGNPAIAAANETAVEIPVVSPELSSEAAPAEVIDEEK